MENNCTFNESQFQNNIYESLINLTSINQLFAGTSYSHLQNFFIAKKTLLLLLNDCIEQVGSNSFSMCVDSALNIYGKHVILPAQSCRELQIIRPNNSDYYLVSASDGSIVQVYCDMTKSCGNITGGLTRVATINSTSYSQHCSSMDIMNDINGCVRVSPLPGCSGITFCTMHLPYSHICGIVDGRYYTSYSQHWSSMDQCMMIILDVCENLLYRVVQDSFFLQCTCHILTFAVL